MVGSAGVEDPYLKDVIFVRKESGARGGRDLVSDEAYTRFKGNGCFAFIDLIVVVVALLMFLQLMTLIMNMSCIWEAVFLAP